MRLRPGSRGRELGTILAFAWAAFPYTAFTLASNANDSLVAALIAWSLAFLTSPAARGVFLGLAVMVKFAPLALAPLFAAGDRAFRPAGNWLRPRKAAVLFTVALAGVVALLLAHPAVEPGLATFYERTIASQIDRTSPFSIWGQADLDWLHLVFELFALGLAVTVAFAPARRSFAQFAALAAAVLISIQLIADHWFYLYIVWFFPPLIAALATLGLDREEDLVDRPG
jgi:hypothetical protein